MLRTIWKPLLPSRQLSDAALVGFALTLAFLFAGCVLAFINARRLAVNQRMEAHTHAIIEQLEVLLTVLKDAETGQRGYLLLEDEKYLKPYTDALERVPGTLSRLKKLTADNTDQQARLFLLEQQIVEKLDELQQTVDLVKGGDRTAAMKIVGGNVGNALMEELRNGIADMQQVEREPLERQSEDSEESYQTVMWSILLTAIAGMLLVSAVYYLGERNVRLRRRSAEGIAEQRERLRVTLASIGDGVITTDERGRVTFLNTVAENLTGWTHEEAAGKPLDLILRLVNERTRAPVNNPVDEVLEHGKIVGLARHTVLIAKDGTERPIDDSAAPIRDKANQLVGTVVVCRDVTESRKAETVLRQNREMLSIALTAAGMGSWKADLKTNICVRDANLNRLLGLGEFETTFTLDDAFSWVHPDDRAGMLEAFDRAVHEHGVYESEVRIATADGRLRWVRERGKVVENESDGNTCMTSVTRDITAEKESEQKVYALVTALQGADHQKDDFLATLAHELRGPLAPLRSMLEIIKRANGDAELIQKAQYTMERQLGQMVRLIDDLLDVSRISRGKLELKKERVELASIVYQSVEACRPLAEAERHALTVKLPEEHLYLNGDPVRLAQIFGNLLNNACKYTEPDGCIGLTVERDGYDVVIRVTDSGVGIPPDRLANIFEMFSQVAGTLERSQGGLGIGLSLVRRLVEMHGGTVSAFSAGLGQGSEFIVRLPGLLEQVHVDERPQPAGRMPMLELESSRRILVVDDNLDGAMSLAMLLKMSGNETQMAHDGLEAIAAAEQFRPDLILLDIGLPKLNGHEVCRRIREQPWGKNMMLVALTGWGQDEDRRKSKDAGFDSHMVKPVDFKVVVKLLAEIQPVPV